MRGRLRAASSAVIPPVDSRHLANQTISFHSQRPSLIGPDRPVMAQPMYFNPYATTDPTRMPYKSPSTYNDIAVHSLTSGRYRPGSLSSVGRNFSHSTNPSIASIELNDPTLGVHPISPYGSLPALPIFEPSPLDYPLLNHRNTMPMSMHTSKLVRQPDFTNDSLAFRGPMTGFPASVLPRP